MNNIENIQEYIPTVYVNDSEPDLDETNLNKTEQAIKRVTDAANKAIDALKQLDREKLALSAISNVLSDATDKVPSLALANTMQLAINDLNSNLEGYYSLSGGTRIPSGADMLADTYRVPGNYACIDNTIASTLKNCPISKAFILKVDLSTGNAYPRQTFLQFNNGKVFTRVFDAFENKWAETFSNITNADIIHGNTDAFSVPANGEHRVTLNLSQYNVGTDYRLYATVRGSTWVNLGAIYCNNNQAIIDLRNLNSTAVNVTLWYTIIRK